MNVLIGILAALAALLLVGYAMNRLAPAVTVRLLTQIRRRLARLTDRQITVDGLQIVYSDGGAGEPMLLLHGLGADRTTFESVAGYFTPRYRVLIPDLVGFGESSRPEGADYGIDAQVERIDRFVTTLGLDQFHLGGNSMGGWIAAAYAARFPDKVKSLWLLAAAGTEDMLQTDAVRVYAERGDYMLLARNPAEFQSMLEHIFPRVPPLPYCVIWAGIRRSASGFPLHSRIFDDLFAKGTDYQLEPRLAQVCAPTLLVWGERDRIVPVTVMRTFERLLPNATSILLENIGHVPQLEAPRRVAQDYLRFLTALRSGGS